LGKLFCIEVSTCWAVGFEPPLLAAFVFECCQGGAHPTISRALAKVRIEQLIIRRVAIKNEVMKGTSPKVVNKKVLLKQINATCRPFGVSSNRSYRMVLYGTVWSSYIFSNLAKSKLRRFFPCLPWNWTSTNSVFCSISLFRMIPSPNLS